VDGPTAASPKMHRSNLDGSVVEDVITTQGFGTITADDCTGMAVDGVRGKVYWTRSVYGEINSADLNGQNAARVIQDYLPTGAHVPAAATTGTFAPGAIAIDTSSGTVNKIYWVNSKLDRIERCNLDGMGRQTLAVGAGATGLALDGAGGKVYWSSTTIGKIQRANLDGTGLEDVAVSPLPSAVALDVAGGFVYWTNTLDRAIRRASISGALPATPSDIFLIGPDVGERAPNGPGTGSSFASWTRLGTPGSVSLPYSIKLTGASFQYSQTMVVKGTQKVAAVGDPVGGVASSRLSIVVPGGSRVKIEDRGNVAWVGRYSAPTIYINYIYDGLFYNQDLLLASMTVPTGTNLSAQAVVYFIDGPYELDLSPSGQNLIVQVNMHDSPYDFSVPQRDNALLYQFTLPPPCVGDFNGDGHVTVQDIFDFLTAWFAHDLRADVNGSGTVTVQDIFDFLASWFAGCP